jgi:hypothetical protein
MVQNGFESRVKVQQIIDSQLPEFVLDENPKASEFLKQYYISQEYQGGSVDIVENLDQYINLDSLIPEVIVGSTGLTTHISASSGIITATSTKGFPSSYGLLKIDDEIITYTGITTNTFTGCVRGFSGITNYHKDLEYQELVFTESSAASHSAGASIENLSSLFLQEFYKKIKFSLTPGLQGVDFTSNLNVGNFIKEARTLYESKGTAESFRILFNVLFGETPTVVDLEQFLIKPSDAKFIRRNVAVVDVISGDPTKLFGQTIKKSTDESTTASVSEVETITRKGKTYYKLNFFIGYDDTYPNVTGTFSITPNTKVVEDVTLNNIGTIITVDSTVGFAESGSIFYNGNKIFYSEKTINQFLGCYVDSNQSINISKTSTIISDDTYYGYEDGDTNRKVEFIITGVLSNVVINSNSYNFLEKEEIYPQNLGKIISKGGEIDQIFANTWIYNTSTRYQIDSFVSSTLTTKSSIDNTSLAVGDSIEVLQRNSETVISGFGNVNVISISGNEITVDVSTSSLNPNVNYDIRRKVKKASSTIVPIQFGNNKITSDVQNVYDENSDSLYVASNSIPSYPIQTNVFEYTVSSLEEENNGSYSQISFGIQNPVSFITGDKVYYYAQNTDNIEGLVEGPYYVEVLTNSDSNINNTRIRLYLSNSTIGSDGYVTFGQFSNGIVSGIHRFVLYSQRSKTISPQKLFRKFKLNQTIGDNKIYETVPGPIGLLKNGVEIYNYKTQDKIYYGPLDNVNVLNGGIGYDVINPPSLSLSTGNALIQPVVKGSIEKIFVDPQDFDVDVVVSVALTGGNGSGASFQPIIEKYVREIEFDARPLSNGGGLDFANERIAFTKNHNLINGQSIVYNSNNFSPIGIGTFGGSNLDQSKTLINGATYYSKIINDRTIEIYQSLSDYSAGINTVGFTTIGNVGIQKFKTEVKNKLSEIKVINSGNGYTNRKLRVKPIGISTYNHTVEFENHGFSNGEIVTYSYETTAISGLSTSVRYQVLKLDSNKFRLCYAGINGTDTSNYERKNYVKFSTTGSGYQIFNYPDIVLSVEYTSVGLGSTQVRGSIVATPIIRGNIDQVYTYEKGSDYGSLILNAHQRPQVVVKNGKESQFTPLIENGRIVDVSVLYGGQDYYSTPDLVVSGSGIGANLRPIVSDNKIVDVIVVNPGAGYSSTDTVVRAISAGKNAVFESSVRSLTLNNSYKYGIQKGNYRDPATEILVETDNNLEYAVIGYSGNIKNNIKDSGGTTTHSDIIGWAYDGNPIYGSYGYSDPNETRLVKKLEPGYSQANIENRPSTSSFPFGYFVEDYEFTNSGDLDQYNGRFGKTKDFPEGVYAYFATVNTNNDGGIVGKFPYFIGNEYRSPYIEENLTLDQSFDFNNSTLIRNTFPYKVNDEYADNDFIVESNEIIEQKTLIESVSSGSVSALEVVNSGSNYKVNDQITFDESDTEGSGIFAKVSEIKGKQINEINTTIQSYNDSLITWVNGNTVRVYIAPYHEFLNRDNINISGLYDQVSNLNGSYQIGLTTYSTILDKQIPAYASTGIVTDVYLTSIPQNVAVGSSFKIDNEIFSVLNIYNNFGVVRVSRNVSGGIHTQTTPVYFLPDSFTVNNSTDYFESKVNDKVYYNPTKSVGIGTTVGVGINVNYNIGITTYNTFIPTQSIFIPNHPFVTGQQVIFRKPTGGDPIAVSNTSTSTSFNILSGNSETLYAINKSKDYIGIVTNVGLTTNTNGLFFRNTSWSSANDDYRYSIESNFTQVTADINKINTVVSVSTSHNLSIGDKVSLNVNPDLSVGIGTSSSIKVLYNTKYGKLMINPIGFGSGSVVPSSIYYDSATRQPTIDTEVGIEWTDKAISPSATRNAQQIYDYIWDNYNNFDVDGDGIVTSVDGLILYREMFDAFPGNALISGITFPSGATRTTASSIRSFISSVTGGVGIGSTTGTAPFSSCYDIDGDGIVTALGDGLMIYRFTTTPELGLGGYYGPGSLESYFQITNHGLKSGDKILYLSNTSQFIPLDDGEYFVHKVDDSKFKLGQTYKDVTEYPINAVSVGFTGGSNQVISLINPQIEVIKNNNLTFDLSDSSLSGYNLKIYYDKDFSKEFVSVATTTSLSISGVGTVGVSTNASLTLDYIDSVPEKLYYNLEKSGYIGTADSDVVNYSEIIFVDSEYKGRYDVIGIATTTFTVSLKNIPEKLSYQKNDCDVLEYTTSSTTATGGINKVNLISGGYGYKSLPRFTGSNSTNGEGAFIIPSSETIGKITQSRIVNEGFEYASDKTLRPTANIPQSVYISSSNSIDSITILNGGQNYASAPDLILVDSDTGELIESGFLKASLTGSSIGEVKIEVEPKGLPIKPVTIRAINNSNSTSIQSVQSSSSGIVTCILTTPIAGFTSAPFAVGDRIFVEGIEKTDSSGDGFNSSDYGYRFFTVTNYFGFNPDKLEFSVSGLTTNPGIAKTIQESYASITNYNSYPEFEVTQKFLPFLIGETLSSDNGLGFITRDLVVTDCDENIVRVSGNYKLSPNERIRGLQSFSEAKIDIVKSASGTYNIDYFNLQNFGWENETGKLSENSQVTPDNDYYQNLSYTVKSSKTWEEIVTPVNNLLHTSGTKNFADTQFEQNVQSGIGTTESTLSLINMFVEDNRVDTINNFDLVVDVDTIGNKSKFIKFNNIRLSDYVLCKTNRVLKIDDISSQFSSSDDERENVSNIVPIVSSNGYNKFLLQVKNILNDETQFSEIVTINNSENIFTLYKGEFTTGTTGYGSTIFNPDSLLANIEGYVDEEGTFYLRFEPEDPFDSNFDIKILQDTFTSKSAVGSTQSLNCVDLISQNRIVSSGITTSIINLDSTKYSSVYSNIHILNNDSSIMNYVEIYLTHDGSDTYIAEYYFDGTAGESYRAIGSFGASLSGGILSLNYTNTESENIIVRSKNVGFGTTALGGGFYRFKLPGQINGNERTVVFESNYNKVSSGSTSVIILDKTLFTSVKSVVRVGLGKTTALHQVMTVYDGTNVSTLQYPFLSIGSTSGIGTFGASIDSNNFTLKFYPDVSISGNIEIISFNECFYTDLDVTNIPPNLNYSPVRQSVINSKYFGANSIFKNKLDFETNYEESQIFMKTFDPLTSLNFATGICTITNHFFNTGEKLIYRPKSTFIGIGTSSIGIGATENYVGVVTTLLPEVVYAIRETKDTIKIATKKEYAEQGIGVTFTSIGLGNAHELEMFKKNEKSLITINNLVQYPISYSYVTHTLSNNGGQISVASTIFALSGISSINPSDLLKIDNEYVSVNNVGLGTTNVGPITFTGNIPLVEVTRGFVGSTAGIHTDTSIARVYRGSYNISGNKIYFTQPPRGNQLDLIGPDENALPRERATFSGRVFLRQDYTSNQIYDDISEKFTGIGQTFILTSQGINTVGLGTSGGNGIVFINSIFQSPTTLNNSSNNYIINENIVAGITTITFSGIRSDIGQYTSDYDINMNQLPRGGIIVSLGSTSGLGYAPLVGASVTAVVSGGSIVSVGLGTQDIIGSGYRGNVSVAVTESGHSGSAATITAIVGAGGTLSFNIVGGGSGYSNPTINVSSPSYENLPVIGVSRLSVGTTTDTGTGLLLNVEVGASSTTGIGSTYFEVTDFKITRNGYGFRRGDVFKPVGLVTDARLASPISEFELTVLDTFTDSFAAWQFGELDYIDSIKNYQNSVRTRFPLFYNSELLSFEVDENLPDSQSINLDNVLLIFANGILQEPGSSYQFNGGTSFIFTVPPKPEDDIAIFFYRGTRGIDSIQEDIAETIKVGDTVQVFSNNSNINNTVTQDKRVVYDIAGSDKIETNLYVSQGIDSTNEKPLYWTKQKVDLLINGDIVSKSRDSIESQIYPTANVIGDFSDSITQIFVDDISLFDYENESPTIGFNAIVFTNTNVGIATTDFSTQYEILSGVNDVKGSSASIVGIATTTGIGVPLALKFTLNPSPPDLQVGYPVYISNTSVGSGVTSIDSSNSNIIAITTSHLNNIYKVHAFNSTTGIITCNIASNTSIVGIATTGTLNYPVGRMSWGRLSGFTRSSSPISIAVTGYTSSIGISSEGYSAGLSTYPVIQRRGFGLRNNGSLVKKR